MPLCLWWAVPFNEPSVPITTRLSQKLHETFGDEAASDMVNWMNGVDTQRAELRELNELNFSRFDTRFAQSQAVFDARFAQAEARFDARLSQAEATVDARLGQFETSIVGRLEAKIEQRTAELMKWSFLFWVGAVAAIAALAGVLR